MTDVLKQLDYTSSQFMKKLALRVIIGRQNHPGNKGLFAASIEEVGEVGTVLEMNEGPERLLDECLDAAGMFMRLGTEGDAAYPLPRPGLIAGDYALVANPNGKFSLFHTSGEGGEYTAEAIGEMLATFHREKF